MILEIDSRVTAETLIFDPIIPWRSEKKINQLISGNLSKKNKKAEFNFVSGQIIEF